MKLPFNIGGSGSARGSSSGFRDIRINMFHEGYEPPVNRMGYVFLSLLAIVAIAGLYPVYTMQADASDETADLQEKLDGINERITELETPSSLAKEVEATKSQISQIENALDRLISDEKIIPTLELLMTTTPQPRLSSLLLSASDISLNGYAVSHTDALAYAAMLTNSESFSDAHITDVGETTESANVEKTHIMGSTSIEITEIIPIIEEETSTEEDEPESENGGFIIDIEEEENPGQEEQGPGQASTTLDLSGETLVAAIGMDVITPAGQSPVTVQFTDQSTSRYPIDSWLWDFGDGSTSESQNTFHTYEYEGTYQIQLTVEDERGTIATTFIGGSNVFSKPNAAYSAALVSCDDPYTVKFTDLSTSPYGNITDWEWDFGDETTSTQVNPVHTFPGEGNYTVTLSVQGSLKTPDIDQKILNITAAPNPDFSIVPVSSGNALTLSFFDESIPSLPTSEIDRWLWKFGDGSSSSEQNPVHTYLSDGPYEITLQVFDEIGNCASRTKTVETTSSDFFADFSVVAASGGNPLAVEFIDLSSTSKSDDITWLWDFGDGTMSEDQNPVHEYLSEGTYTVSLSIVQNMSDPNTPELEKIVSTGITGEIQLSEGTSTPFKLLITKAS